MRIFRACWYGAAATAAIVALLLVSRSDLNARQSAGPVVIDADDIGGTVTGGQGPEAGVWVIAQTMDLPTPFMRIVVTDDRGRYLLPYLLCLLLVL